MSVTNLCLRFVLFLSIFLTNAAIEDYLCRADSCHMISLMAAISLPATRSQDCIENVTFHRCRGYCLNETRPILTLNSRLLWSYRDYCCKPTGFVETVVHFPDCGGSFKYRDTISCSCEPCTTT